VGIRSSVFHMLAFTAGARYEVFTAMKIQPAVFSVVTPWYQRFGGPCRLHLQGELLPNIGIQPRHYMASQLSRPRHEFTTGESLLWSNICRLLQRSVLFKCRNLCWFLHCLATPFQVHNIEGQGQLLNITVG